MLRKFKASQSTIEYILIITAVIAAIAFVAVKLRPKIQNSMDGVTNNTEDAVGKLNFDKAGEGSTQKIKGNIIPDSSPVDGSGGNPVSGGGF